MQAYKLKGKIDAAGHLNLSESIELPAGDVEVIILQEVNTETEPVNLKPDALGEKQETPTFPYKTNIFTDLLSTVQPVSPDFDVDEARWEALREKHQL